MLQIVTRPGRPPLGPHPMTGAERKARSRSERRVGQVNVEVPERLREQLRQVAANTGRTQAEVLVAAITEYLARYGPRPTRPAVDDRPLTLASAIVRAVKRGPVR